MLGVKLFGLWPLMKDERKRRTIKIGTRGSMLALWQANWVKSSLTEKDPSLRVELVIIKTKGDKILDVPLAKVGGKGLFVKEIEDALLNGEIDIAVHSMKDMPTEIPGGLCIAAVPERETVNDVLISKGHLPLAKLPSGAAIGTSSLRRASQLKYVRPDVVISPLRGNLDTRIKKLETDKLDGVILAAAGVKRLGLENRISEYLDETVMLPAVGQGALCIETRADDPDIRAIAGLLDHPETRVVVLGERAFLRRLEGGCQIPIAALGRVDGDIYTLKGLVADVDGSALIQDLVSGTSDEFERIGVELAERLLSKGAKEILDKLKTE